jgi:hypothetical protein
MSEERKFNLDEEVGQIDDPSIRLFVTKALEQVPSYFWHVPASASGRFHPLDTLGEGGLVLHTKRVVYLATEIAKIFKIDEAKLDVLRAAAILHDSFKNGLVDEDRTEADHPLIVRHQLKDMPRKPLEWSLHIADFIASRTAVYLYFSGYEPKEPPADQEFENLSLDLEPAINRYLDLRANRTEIEKQMEEVKKQVIEEMNRRGERKIVTTKGSARLQTNTHFKISQAKLKPMLEKLGFWDKVTMVNEKRLQELLNDGIISEEDLGDAVEKIAKDSVRILPRED